MAVLLDYPELRYSDCELRDDYIKVVIDIIDILRLPSPISNQQQLDNIEARRKVLVSMANDSVYDLETRSRIFKRSKIPIKNDYVSPLTRFLESRGIDVSMPYRVFCSPTNDYEYIFFQ